MKTHLISYQISFPIIFLLLSISSWTVCWTFKANYPEWNTPNYIFGDIKEAFFQAIPEPLRILGADICWITADEYMHYGGVKELGQNFLAGSFAGNTEILPVLELAIRLDPAFFDVYEILAHNFSYYLNRFTDGIRLLQKGIQMNRKSPRVHELYGTIGYLYFFINKYTLEVQKNPEAAFKYLTAAIEMFFKYGSTNERNPMLGPRFYYMVIARILVEKGDLDGALKAWRASGEPLENSDDLLGIFLWKYSKGESVPALPEDLPEAQTIKSSIEENLSQKLKHSHESCRHCQKENTENTHKFTNSDFTPSKRRKNPVMVRLKQQITGYFVLLAGFIIYRLRLKRKIIRPKLS